MNDGAAGFASGCGGDVEHGMHVLILVWLKMAREDTRIFNSQLRCNMKLRMRELKSLYVNLTPALMPF